MDDVTCASPTTWPWASVTLTMLFRDLPISISVLSEGYSTLRLSFRVSGGVSWGWVVGPGGFSICAQPVTPTTRIRNRYGSVRNLFILNHRGQMEARLQSLSVPPGSRTERVLLALTKAACVAFAAAFLVDHGGLAAFGLLGLFLGPVIMAALLTVWREWIFRPAVRDQGG